MTFVKKWEYDQVRQQRDNWYNLARQHQKKIDLQREIGEWSVRTFGTEQSLEGLENHLKRELAELLSAPNFESKIEEASDMMILLFGIAHRRGYDALEEAGKKFREILIYREWEKPDSEGVISHKRS